MDKVKKEVNPEKYGYELGYGMGYEDGKRGYDIPLWNWTIWYFNPYNPEWDYEQNAKYRVGFRKGYREGVEAGYKEYERSMRERGKHD